MRTILFPQQFFQLAESLSYRTVLEFLASFERSGIRPDGFQLPRRPVLPMKLPEDLAASTATLDALGGRRIIFPATSRGQLHTVARLDRTLCAIVRAEEVEEIRPDDWVAFHSSPE